MDHTGYNTLAGVLHTKMTKTSKPHRIVDFGEIQSNYSLKTNFFPVEIPPKDYVVCREATMVGQNLTQTKTGEDVLLPPKMAAIKPGDRVFVIWNDATPVVIDVICPATEVINNA
jgi:hypothetical protein